MIQGRILSLKRRLGIEASPGEGLKEALQWLFLGRLGVLYALVTALVLNQVLGHSANEATVLIRGYLLIGVAFAVNLLMSLSLDFVGARWWVAVLNIAFDAAVTSVWIRWGGEEYSLFALLYLVQILMVSLTLYQRGAWIAAGMACVGFGFATLFRPVPELTGWVMFSAIFVTIGVVGGYLSEELLRTGQSLKEKQKKIEKLSDLHERILSHMPTGLLTVDRTMRVNFVNQAGAHILGKTIPEIQGKLLGDVATGLIAFFSQIEAEEISDEADAVGDPDQKVESTKDARVRQAAKLFLQARSSGGNARLQQMVELSTEGGTRVVRGDVAELDPAAGVGVLLDQEASGGRVLLFQDVTKLFILEDKLRQHEKLAAVGQLAAGIAHEIRNPLAGMSASIEMLREGIPAQSVGSENQKLMDIALREIDRLNRLISEFLDYVKPENLKFETVSLADLLGDVVLGAKQAKELAAKVTIVEKYDPRAMARASQAKLRQVVLNLLMNAVHASKKGGTVEIGCQAHAGNRVSFWVSDQGHGMSEEVKKHLYEPFFTTKEKGTGLGLATAYKIVEAHQGEIKVQTEVGKGTRFEVFLSA